MATTTLSQSQSPTSTPSQLLQHNELPLNFYSNAFSSLQPRKAHNTLIGRLKSAKLFNEELSEYFKERLSIEDQYVKSLFKLSKKPNGLFKIGNQTNSTTNEDEEISGGISKIKQLLQSELIDLMDSHSKFQIKVNAQVESSFRNCSTLTHPNWSKIMSLEDNLNVTIKNCEDLEAKWNKSKVKLNGTSNIKKIQTLQLRLTEDQKNLNQAKQLYLDQAPMIYDSYQKFDQSRLLNLIETLTKFETIQADHSREKLEIFERSLNNLMSFNCRDEMERFAIKNGLVTQSIPESRSPGRNLLDSSSASSPPPGSQYPHPSSKVLTSRDPLQSSVDRQHTSELTQFLGSSTCETAPSTQNPLLSSTSTYDPNHASIPKLSAPNVSVPIRSDTMVADTTTSSLPSRDLYVQRQPSLKSMSYMHRVGSASNLSRLRSSPSSRSISSNAKPGSSHSLADKIFSKSRLTNLLARNSGDEPNASQARQSFVARVGDGHRSNRNETGSPILGRPAHRRNSSLANSTSTPNQCNLYDMTEMEKGVTEEAEEEREPSSSRNKRLSSFNLTSSSILPKRKASRSAPSLPPPLLPEDVPPLPAFSNPLDHTKVDAEGFTIPPDDRDRKPWETNGKSSELLEDEEDTNPNKANDGMYKNVRSSRSTGALGALTQVAIKPTSPIPINESESERMAAFQKVQDTLSSVTSNLSASTSRAISTRRSVTGLRGRRADGRGMTMYDTSNFSVPRLERAASSIGRESSTENVPLSVVRDAKILKKQEEAKITSSQELNLNVNNPRLKPNPFISPISLSSPIELNHVLNHHDHEDENPQTSVSFSQPFTNPQPSSSLSQLNLEIINGNETNEREIEKSRANSVVSSMSYHTGAFGFSNSQGTNLNGTNPFLNRSFSPSISLPGSASHTSGFHHHPLNSTLTHPPKYSDHGLTVIIKETLNVLMDQGEVTKLLILGEIKFVWPSLIEENLKENEVMRFKIENFERLEKIVCPLSFIKSRDSRGEYDLNLNEFKSKIQEEADRQSDGNHHQTSCEYVGLKYRIYFDSKGSNHDDANRLEEMERIKLYLPIYVIPRWRGKKSKTELMLTYEANERFHQFSTHPIKEEEEKWEIEEMEMSTRVYNPSSLPTNSKHLIKKSITSHQEIPLGQFDSKLNEIKWNSLKLSSGSKLQRIIGRFNHLNETNDGEEEEEEEEEPIELVRSNCGPIQVKMRMRGICLSGIDLKVLNDKKEEGGGEGEEGEEGSGIRRVEEVVFQVVSGTFLAR
ncbi:hypothetical protein DFH28DRAFT_1219374 [Melampsora americana]|nr:hypothetical protein DFH28DRAFT_1219374 [Melampsora americana]